MECSFFSRIPFLDSRENIPTVRFKRHAPKVPEEDLFKFLGQHFQAQHTVRVVGSIRVLFPDDKRVTVHFDALMRFLEQSCCAIYCENRRLRSFPKRHRKPDITAELRQYIDKGKRWVEEVRAEQTKVEAIESALKISRALDTEM